MSLVHLKFFFDFGSPTTGKTPLVNVVPKIILHQKMHELVSVYFLGRSTTLPAPCDAKLLTNAPKNSVEYHRLILREINYDEF